MFQVVIDFDPRPLKAFEANADANTILRATTRAANKAGGDAIRKVRIESSRIIRAKKRLKLKVINRGLPTSRSGSARRLDSLEWRMKVSNEPVPMAAYPSRRTKKGLSVEINVGKRKVIKSAFLAKMRTGYKGAFKRKEGAGRLPIKQLFSSTLAQTFSDDDVERKITVYARSTFMAAYARLWPMELAKIPK